MASEFLPFTKAAQEAGISALTLRKRVAAGEIATYRNALDKRLRLVRLEDLNALRTPRQSSENSGRRSAA